MNVNIIFVFGHNLYLDKWPRPFTHIAIIFAILQTISLRILLFRKLSDAPEPSTKFYGQVMSGKVIKDGDRSTEPHDTEFSFYESLVDGGMARAGLGNPWRCLLVNDMDPIKASTYIDNWGGEHFDTRDVREILFNDLPCHADLIWASFPCQDLSLAGNGLGIGDRDSSADEIMCSGAVWPFLDLIDKLSEENRKPPLLALENVLGLLTLD